jgi:hypothetical protein
MSKGQEILKKLLEDDNIEAFSSKENLKNVLKENGLTEEEIESTLAGIKDFPLDDDDLDTITGGLSSSTHIRFDITTSKSGTSFSREEE